MGASIYRRSGASVLAVKLVYVALATVLTAPTLARGEGMATPSECKDGFEDCKENCTMEFGTSVTTREKLGQCLIRCTRTHDECQERYFDVTSNKLDPDALTQKRPNDPAAAPKPRSRDDDDARLNESPAREEPAADSRARREETRVESSTPREQPGAELRPVREEPTAEPRAPREKPTIDSRAPRGQPAAEARPPREKPAAEAPPPRKQPAADARPPRENPAAEGPPPRKQPEADAREPSEKPTAGPRPPREEPAAESRAGREPPRGDDVQTREGTEGRPDDWVPGDPTPKAAPPKKKGPDKPPPAPPTKTEPPPAKKGPIDEWDPNGA